MKTMLRSMNPIKPEPMEPGTVKQFRVPAKKPITVSFVNLEPKHTRIRVGGKLVKGDIKIPPAGKSGKRKLSLQVEFLKKAGEDFLHIERQLGVEIQTGGMTIRDIVLPDVRRRGIDYMFLEEPDPGLTYCPKHKIVVRGRCPKCH